MSIHPTIKIVGPLDTFFMGKPTLKYVKLCKILNRHYRKTQSFFFRKKPRAFNQIIMTFKDGFTEQLLIILYNFYDYLKVEITDKRDDTEIAIEVPNLEILFKLFAKNGKELKEQYIARRL